MKGPVDGLAVERKGLKRLLQRQRRLRYVTGDTASKNLHAFNVPLAQALHVAGFLGALSLGGVYKLHVGYARVHLTTLLIIAEVELHAVGSEHETLEKFLNICYSCIPWKASKLESGTIEGRWLKHLVALLGYPPRVVSGSVPFSKEHIPLVSHKYFNVTLTNLLLVQLQGLL